MFCVVAMYRLVRDTLRGALVCAFLCSTATLEAAQFPLAEPNGFTWGELALLPDYCKDTQGTLWDKHGNGGQESPNLPKWVALMGQDFFHAHHYCYGLRNILRARATGVSSPKGKDLLRGALDQFSYMIRNCNPTMRLMPEIYLKQGEVHLMLGSTMEAKRSFEMSREAKPDYWPAYTRWADQLLGLKLYDSARQLLEEGLANSPNEPELLKRLQTLGDRPASVAAKKAARAASVALAAPAASAIPPSSPASGP